MHHLAKGIERHTAMPAGSVTEAVRRESLVYLCIHFFSLPRESRNFAARIFLYALGKRRVHFFVGTLILFALPGFEWVTPICCGPRFLMP
jgi:hypothetical protein